MRPDHERNPVPAHPTDQPLHPFDEAFDGPEVREPYRELMDRLQDADLGRLGQEVSDALAQREVRFGGEEGHDLHVDPVPRILTGPEWEELSAGVRQRVRALERLVADTYGEQRLVADGVLPAEVVSGSTYFERDMVGLQPPGGARIALAGLDVVRDSTGRFRVLEDNVRTPSGLAYAMAASDAVTEVLAAHCPDEMERARTGRALRRAMEAAAPDGEGALVLLCDGPSGAAWYDQRRLAELAALELATPADLRRVGSRLELADGRPVRSVFRRTGDDRFRHPSGELSDVADLVLEPLLEGHLGLVNWYGSGVADDKGVYAYVDRVIREVLGEEPILGSVATYDLSDPQQLEQVLDSLPELVVKPRGGQGGQGVVVGPAATAQEIEQVRPLVRRDPGGWIAQEAVALSTVPTVVGGRLQARHCDLRPFAISDGEEVFVPRGGLTRVAMAEGSMVVDSSREGGAKATWVA